MHGLFIKINRTIVLGLFLLAAVAAVLVYQAPAVRARLSWRMEKALAFSRGVIDPVRPIPTAVGQVDTSALPLPPTATAAPTAIPPSATPTRASSPTPPAATPTPVPLPSRVMLEAPAYEMQDINNCGPATLAMYLRYYGWEGDQFDISDVIKPVREDRNVNIEEMVYYMHTQVYGMEGEFRVGGDLTMLRRLLAGGFPVVIEESMKMDESFWYNDDLWAGHYLLLTGYDDASQTFTAHDSFRGASVSVNYSDLDRGWKAFNRVYLVVYPTGERDQVKGILGQQWDVDQNRKHALELAEKEVKKDSTDSYAWFNLGTNLVYFEQYQDAGKAYDTAISLGLPQRMLRYQFGPFFAYFHTGRSDDLLAIADYALKRTPNAEEAWLWKGWALYRKGQKANAIEAFEKALQAHPGYPDAEYALKFVISN